MTEDVFKGVIMRRFLVATAAFLAVGVVPATVAPAIAAADPAICHNGVLSDDAGQGCADGLYAQTYGSSGSSTSSGGGICHDGILSNDAGQGCSDGLYEQTYSGSSPAPVSTGSGSSGGGYSAPSSSYGGGSSNSMVNPQCESGGNSQVVDSTGTYWGKYQFDRQTWAAHGGNPGSYGSAGEAEQDRVASRVTYDAWPNC